jgi:hypothetical protein
MGNVDLGVEYGWIFLMGVLALFILGATVIEFIMKIV